MSSQFDFAILHTHILKIYIWNVIATILLTTNIGNNNINQPNKLTLVNSVHTV